jgi:hypothetical protein
MELHWGYMMPEPGFLGRRGEPGLGVRNRLLLHKTITGQKLMQDTVQGKGFPNFFIHKTYLKNTFFKL